VVQFPRVRQTPLVNAARRRPRRGRPAGSSCARAQKRVPGLDEPSLADQLTDLERVLAAVDDLELRADLHALRVIGRVLRAGRLQGPRG